MGTAVLWDLSPAAPRGRAGWAAKASFTRFISFRLYNDGALERCWYDIWYANCADEASVRWRCGFWPRILSGNFMKPWEGNRSLNNRSNGAGKRSRKALTVGKI